MLEISEDAVEVVTWDKDDSVNFLKNIISKAKPVVIKNLPRKLFNIFELDLMKLSSMEDGGEKLGKGLELNFIQWQNHHVFIASHEREKGKLACTGCDNMHK